MDANNQRDRAGWIGAGYFFALIAVDVVYGIVKGRESLVTWIDLLLGALALFALFAHQITEFAISKEGFSIKQKHSPEAISPGGEAAQVLAIVDSEGFLSEDHVKQIVAKSSLIGQSERVVRKLLL